MAKINHIIVIMMENHSFDNYFGTYPGANGLPNNVCLPISKGSNQCVHPYHFNSTTLSGDLCHDWNCAHIAYDKGKMDGFVYADKGSALSMGYFDYRQIPYYWDYASQFVLLDNYFSSLMGPTTPNRMYLLAGQSGGITSDVNLLPNRSAYTFYFKFIGDELNTKGITWKYYSGFPDFFNGFNPLPAFSEFKTNASMWKHLAYDRQFFIDIAQGNLPHVAFVTPQSDQCSEHPPYDVTCGQNFVVRVVNAVMQSRYWNSSAIFVTWDEYGGFYDHVPPPQVDKFGYGFRVPLLIISPYARQGFIDHKVADHTSILKFIETIFSLPPLTQRDASASNLMEAFDFSQPPRPPLVLPGPYIPNHYPLTLANATASHFTTTAGQSSTNTALTSPPGLLNIDRRLLILLMVVLGLLFTIIYLKRVKTTHQGRRLLS
jgi:phospholipase C